MVVKASRSPAERLDLLSILRKYILCWAFLTSAVAFTDHLTSLLMWIPRYLKLVTFSTSSLLIRSGWCTVGPYLKSIMSSLVFLMVNDRLLTAHHSINLQTSSL